MSRPMSSCTRIALALTFAISVPAHSEWNEPFEIRLPEPLRSLKLAAGVDVQRWADEHGLALTRTLPLGRRGNVLEFEASDETWQALEPTVCGDARVTQCGLPACQKIQLEGTVGAEDATSVRGRLVKNPPELVPVPDEADLAAGSCRGAPLVPLTPPGAEVGGDVVIDLDLRNKNSGKTGVPIDAKPASLDAADIEPAVQPATQDAPPEHVVKNKGFEFDVTGSFAAVDVLNLHLDQLPTDTTEWSLMVGAGCNQV